MTFDHDIVVCTTWVFLERPNIGIRYRSFFFDVEGKIYDIAYDVVYDIVYNIVYTYLTCRISDAGPSLPIPGNSDSDLHDFGPSQAAKGPISQFLADMPSTMHAFQDDFLKAIDGPPIPSAGPVTQGLSLREAIEVLPTNHAHWWFITRSSDTVSDIVYDI